MAVLQSGKLSFHFQFVGFTSGYIEYRYTLCWQDEPIVNDDVLKRDNDYWDKRPKGWFLADEFRQDRFVPFLRRILEEDKADYWESLDPDVMVAIYPDGYFPFLKSHWVLMHQSTRQQKEQESRLQRKKEQGKLPDDSYTVIVFFDAYHFKSEDVYQGDGISLHLVVQRTALKAFTNALSREYEEFKTKFRIDEWNAEND